MGSFGTRALLALSANVPLLHTISELGPAVTVLASCDIKNRNNGFYAIVALYLIPEPSVKIILPIF